MNKMNVVCIIQARLGNNRLPGKVLKIINNKSMLERVQSQVMKCKLVDTIIIAAHDPELIDHKMKQIEFFCDPSIDETDVLKRTHEAASLYDADIIVRVTSDCPLVNSELIDIMIAIAIKEDLPYLSIDGLEGVFGEIFGYNQLKIANTNAITQHEREHVTPYIKSMAKEIVNKRMYLDGYKLSVDTESDLEHIKTLTDILETNDDHA